MSHFFNEDQKLFQQSVRQFVDEYVRPRAAEIDQTHKFPMDLWEACAEMGLTGIIVPEELEGLGADLTTEAMIMEEVAKACPTLALTLDVNYYCISDILGYGTPEQQKKFIPDLASGRKIGGLSSTDPIGSSNKAEWPVHAVRQGDYYVVNATKVFQTNVEYSSTVVMNLMGENGPIKLILEKDKTEGVEVGHIERKMGLNGSSTGTMILKDVKIPVENEMSTTPNRFGSLARTDVAAICLGIAQEAFDRTFAYLKERTKNRKPLASYGAVGSTLAKIATELELGRSLIYNSARLFDEGGDPALLGHMAKAWTSEMAVRNVSRCIELYGGLGYIEDTGLAMLMRDAQGLCLAEGSTNLALAVVQNLMGIQVDYV